MFQACPPGKPSWQKQKDLEGKEFDLGTNWAPVDMDTWIDRVIEAKEGTFEEVRQKGFIQWVLEGKRTFDTEALKKDCDNNKMRFDPELHKRLSRGDMQRDAQAGHTGEARWTNMDGQCYEVISSGCAIVGVFVGYGVSVAKDKSGLCKSRKNNAECTVNWDLMPPLCRPFDGVDAKNEWVVVNNAEAAASSSANAGDTHDPLNPESVDFD